MNTKPPFRSAPDLRPALPAQRILVADDSETIRALMADILQVLGYVVITAPDGDTAIDELKRCDPQLVLLDIEMPPGIDGCEVCRRIKVDPQTRGIPVLLVSANPDTSERAAAAGADGFLQKPFLIDDFEEWVRLLLSTDTRKTA